MDETPAESSGIQEALRVAMTEMLAHAATGARVEESIRVGGLLITKIDRVLAENERDRADWEKDRGELRAAIARMEADLKRFADAKAALAQVEATQQQRAEAEAAAAETRWRARIAPAAAAIGVLLLILERLMDRLRGAP